MTLQDLIRNKKRVGGIRSGGRKSVWKRDKNKCRRCGCAVVDDLTVKKFAGEVHHLNKNAEDGSMLNKILLCKQCHSDLHKLSEEDYIKRIKEISGIETEVIEDRKTFAMIAKAERGGTLAELEEITHYTRATIFDLLAAVNVTLGERKSNKEVKLKAELKESIKVADSEAEEGE